MVGKRAGGRSWLIRPSGGGKVRILNRKFLKLAPVDECNIVVESAEGAVLKPPGDRSDWQGFRREVEPGVPGAGSST